MHLIVNGERVEVAATTLTALLSEMEYEHDRLAVAINRRVVPRKRWPETALDAGDQIEIITPRQGG